MFDLTQFEIFGAPSLVLYPDDGIVTLYLDGNGIFDVYIGEDVFENAVPVTPETPVSIERWGHSPGRDFTVGVEVLGEHVPLMEGVELMLVSLAKEGV